MLVVQQLLVALYSGTFHRMQEHISRIIPLLLKLGSEAPALLGLIPMLKEICVPGKDRRSSGSNNGPWGADSGTSTRRSQENPYSDAHFPPPPLDSGEEVISPHRSDGGTAGSTLPIQRKPFCKMTWSRCALAKAELWAKLGQRSLFSSYNGRYEISI